MKDLSSLLRDADPLGDNPDAVHERRDEIRRIVVAAASAGRSTSGASIRRRHVLAGMGAVVAALVIAGVLIGSGNRGTLQAAVRFEVRLAETQPVPGLIVAQIARTGRVIYLHPESVVTNDDIAQSWVMPDGPDRFSISVEFLQTGAERMRQATAAHIGKPVAILIDGNVVIAPVIRSAITNSALITGDYSQADAERIARGISVR